MRSGLERVEVVVELVTDSKSSLDSFTTRSSGIDLPPVPIPVLPGDDEEPEPGLVDEDISSSTPQIFLIQL